MGNQRPKVEEASTDVIMTERERKLNNDKQLKTEKLKKSLKIPKE